MRPRVFPAEDIEATYQGWADAAASMRPRVFPAEDEQDQLPARGSSQALQ